MTETPFVNEFQREARHMKHRLFAMLRERFGCKYTSLPYGRYREAVHWLADGSLG